MAEIPAVIGKFRRYLDKNGKPFYTTGPLDMSGPRTGISRWDVDLAYRELEKANGVLPKGSLSPETLERNWMASAQDEEVRKRNCNVWLSHLILMDGTPVETNEYVLKHADGRPVKTSHVGLLLNPTQIIEDGSRRIVYANVFELPFVPFGLSLPHKDGVFDIENIDSETGFLNSVRKDGPGTSISFRDKKGLYATWVSSSGGWIYCSKPPSYLDNHYFGLTASTKEAPPAQLIEDEVGNLLTEAETMRLEMIRAVGKKAANLSKRFGDDPRLVSLKETLQ